jgi:aspartyl protease family protein
VLARGQIFWIVMAVLGVGLILLIVNDSSNQSLGFSSDVAGRALYLGVWGSVIAAGILGSGRRLGDIARNLGLWALLILAFVAVYQYRYELQDFASRVSAGLIPGSPMTVACDGNQVMLDKLGNGHFGARGEVNGKPVDFLVDTGASGTVLTFRDAAAVGIDTTGLSFAVPVQTANGSARAALAFVDTIGIGSIERRNLRVFVSEDGSLDMSLLGMNFLDTLSGYEVRGDRMILRD